jgi:hypothetical protein
METPFRARYTGRRPHLEHFEAEIETPVCVAARRHDEVQQQPRVLRVAWLLQSLCLKEGSAFANDSYISDTLGIQLNHVQAALAELERAGAIVRASSFVDGKPQRRI